MDYSIQICERKRAAAIAATPRPIWVAFSQPDLSFQLLLESGPDVEFVFCCSTNNAYK